MSDFDKDALVKEIVGMLRRRERFKVQIDSGIAWAGYWIGLGLVLAAWIVTGKEVL